MDELDGGLGPPRAAMAPAAASGSSYDPAPEDQQLTATVSTIGSVRRSPVTTHGSISANDGAINGAAAGLASSKEGASSSDERTSAGDESEDRDHDWAEAGKPFGSEMPDYERQRQEKIRRNNEVSYRRTPRVHRLSCPRALSHTCHLCAHAQFLAKLGFEGGGCGGIQLGGRASLKPSGPNKKTEANPSHDALRKRSTRALMIAQAAAAADRCNDRPKRACARNTSYSDEPDIGESDEEGDAAHEYSARGVNRAPQRLPRPFLPKSDLGTCVGSSLSAPEPPAEFVAQ